MSSLAEKLTNYMGAAFAASDLSQDLGIVRVSDRPDLAQFQCNGAMSAAKIAKKAPRQIAEEVVKALKEQDQDQLFTKIEIAGPGFINLNVTDEFLANHLSEMTHGERLGVDKVAEKDQTIILDYGGPNIAKPMHVGHLRSSIIGDSLRRICTFAGYKALGDVHMGDWGTPMGMIISELGRRKITASDITLEILEDIYPTAARSCKDDSDRMDEARELTQKLQDGDESCKQYHQRFIEVSIAGMKNNFDALGVHFDLWKGESDAHSFIEGMVEEYKEHQWAHESDGALVVPVEQDDDRKEMPPLLLLKSDGAAMYGTTDLATIFERVNEYNPSEIIYVVDQRQSLHFEQVFRAARKSDKISEDLKLIHAGFGTMNGTDGKPFKTREGGVMKLEDLISSAIEKAEKRLDEAELAKDIGEQERTDIAHKVAIAAIKFADLQNNRIADYVFDIDRMTSFEGKTGPYLLYQNVRIKSLLRKAQDQGFTPGDDFVIEESDRALALLLTELPDHFGNALKNYTPHVLCDYAYRLAQSFSSFYGSCHILSEKNQALRASRLALCDLTCKQLELVLGLLGIKTPDRM